MTGAAFDFQAPAATPETSAAARFLVLLDESAERFTFQTFDDTGKGRRDLSSIRHGALDALKKYLVELNSAGAGVYVTVNKTDLQGRKAENITHVRAFFVDLDGAPLEPVLAAPITPHIVVESSPKRFHAYWRVADCPLDLFRPIQKALAARFDGDSSVNDLPRIMRLPGFYHCKREPFLTQILSDEPGDVTLAEFCEAFGIDPQEKPPAKHHTEPAASSSMGSWKATVAKIAAVAAERTHQNTGSRHSQSLWIGGELARVGIVSTDEIISYTVECYRRLCRPTNTKGEVAFDVQTAINAVRHGYEKAAKDGELGLKNTLPITPRNDTPADLDALIAALTGDRRQHADEIRAALTAIKADARLDGSKHTASQTIGFALCTEYGGCPDAELGRALCAEWDARTGGNAVTTYRNADPNYQGPTGPVTVDSVYKLARVCGWTGAKAGIQTEPEPLRREPAPPEPFPLDALGPILAPAAASMAEGIQCPKTIAAMSVLAVASQAAQAHRDVLIDGRKIPLSLWMLTVAESGERKSAVDSVALTPLAVHQKALIEKNEIDRAIYERDLQIWKREKERALGGKGKIAPDRKAMQDALDAIGPEPEPPLLPFLKVNDLTYEGIYKALAAGQPSIALISDEAGQFVGGHAMNPENLLKTVSGLSKLWDGGELSRVRAGDGASILYGRRLAMHLMMQPVVAELLFSNPLTAGQGFLARVLAAWPESNVGRQVYQERDLSLDPAVATYNETIKNLLEMEPPLADGKHNELAPAGLTLAPDAKRLYIQYHDTINRQAAAGEPLAPIRAFALKIHDQALRIAGVLTLVASPRANQISLDTLADAIKLTDWFLNEQLRINGLSGTNPDIILAEQLLSWISEQDLREIYPRKIYQFGPAKIRDKATASRVISILENHGWLIPLPDGSEVDGKPRRKAWMLWGENS